ncbi:MAG: hypothetical protein KBA64_01770 [Armatimonadetes bacterium]|nr:hypothetical protein [Armatimonadota bacterium]
MAHRRSNSGRQSPNWHYWSPPSLHPHYTEAPVTWPAFGEQLSVCIPPHSREEPRCDAWLAGTCADEPSHVCMLAGDFSLAVARQTLAERDGGSVLWAVPDVTEVPDDGETAPGFCAFRQVGDTVAYVVGIYEAIWDLVWVGDEWGGRTWQEPDGTALWHSTETLFVGPVTRAACDAALRVQAWFDRALLGRPRSPGRPVGTRVWAEEEFRQAFSATVAAHPRWTQELIADALACSPRTLRQNCRDFLGESYSDARARILSARA